MKLKQTWPDDHCPSLLARTVSGRRTSRLLDFSNNLRPSQVIVMSQSVVLIVDNLRLNREKLGAIVHGMGHRPVDVAGIDDAKRELDRNDCDLILLDLDLDT